MLKNWFVLGMLILWLTLFGYRFYFTLENTNMKSDYNFLVTKNRNKMVNVTGWQARVFLPTGLFIAKPDK